MFRLCRKTVFPRWHAKRQKPVDKKQNVTCPKAVVLCTSSNKKSYSDSNQREEKQHADRQGQRFWDDPQFYCNFFHSSLLETAGVLGTAALCFFNYHLKYINHILEYDRANSSCLFSNIVLAMPKRSTETKRPVPSEQNSVIFSEGSQNQKKNEVSSDISFENIKKLADKYAAAIENAAGVSSINTNDKKAFRSFQTASRLGSSQAFYNLGLCYQFGKGTKVNLNMAAFCYRKAAMKGHGLASFNLAVFFFKGLGGLPVDPKFAKELLAQAADKGVPEAQVYFGIECLENKKWLDAVKIFTGLAEKNIPDGQYYLGLCYENGFGVRKDEKIAVDLYTKSAAQGSEKAIKKLQDFEKNKQNDLEISVKTHTLLKSSGLHNSSSVPELGAVVKKPDQTVTKVSILSYLDLITPFLFGKENCNYQNNSNNADSITREYPSTYIPFRNISLVAVQIKT